MTILLNIHSSGVIHSNLKPSKILVSSAKPNSLALSDFSKCHSINENFRNQSTLVYQDKERKKLAFQRNPNIFSSVNIHHGGNPTIGDDFESLAYILLYFSNGGKWFINDLENYELKNYEARMRALTLYKLTTSMAKQCSSLPR